MSKLDCKYEVIINCECDATAAKLRANTIEGLIDNRDYGEITVDIKGSKLRIRVNCDRSFALLQDPTEKPKGTVNALIKCQDAEAFYECVEYVESFGFNGGIGYGYPEELMIRLSEVNDNVMITFPKTGTLEDPDGKAFINACGASGTDHKRKGITS